MSSFSDFIVLPFLLGFAPLIVGELLGDVFLWATFIGLAGIWFFSPLASTRREILVSLTLGKAVVRICATWGALALGLFSARSLLSVFFSATVAQ